MLDIADLFCGGGGTTTGACEAITAAGYQSRVTAINHWDVAIETHSMNHPQVNHHCQDLTAASPRALVKKRHLHLLLAAPSCTHHSDARGGVPRNEKESLSDILGALPDGFYETPRFELPEMLWEAAFDRRDPVGQDLTLRDKL